MILNSFTGTGVAASVWAAAARTLTNPSGVWNDATKAINGIKAAFTYTAQTDTTLATGVNVDFQAAAGAMRFVSCVMTTPNVAGASGAIAIWDGTTTRIITAIGQNATNGVFQGLSGNSVRMKLANNGTQTNNIQYMIAETV